MTANKASEQSQPRPQPMAQRAHQDDDGWTRVPAKSRRRGGKAQATTANRHHGTVGVVVPPRTENLRSADDIASEYRRIRSQWETEDAAQALRCLVTDYGPREVSKAMCLGIGTFDPPDGGWDTKRRTYVQLIAFLLLVEALETKLNRKIECIFQEPVFTKSDKAFITSLGHRVVDSPQGFELISPDSLLFAVHLYRPIYAMALERCLPVVFIGTDLDVWDTVSMGDSDDLINGRAMEKAYKKTKCPQDSSSTAFTSTCIYWRPDEQTKPAGDSKPGDSESESPPNTQAEQDLAEKLGAVTLA